MSSSFDGLSVSGLTVRYGGVVANDAVSLQVRSGSIVGLIGPNGAGKTTFVDAVTGFTRYDGVVRLGEGVLDGLPPHQRARAGLARTWQSLELFDDLPVRDNLLVAARPSGLRSMFLDAFRPGRRPDPDRVDWALELLGLTAAASSLPSTLSLGERKLLGIARALSGSPRAVLLDEPASGLDAAERDRMGSHLEMLAAEGLAVLLIDHDVNLVLASCGSVSVLDFGRVIASGTPAEVRADERVLKAYLGSTAA